MAEPVYHFRDKFWMRGRLHVLCKSDYSSEYPHWRDGYYISDCSYCYLNIPHSFYLHFNSLQSGA